MKLINYTLFIFAFFGSNLAYAVTKYENVKITNVYHDVYKGKPMFCASFSNQTQSHSGCLVDSQGASYDGGFPYYVRMLQQSYLTGDILWIKINNNVWTDPLVTRFSSDEIGGVGSCRSWCFGADLNW